MTKKLSNPRALGKTGPVVFPVGIGCMGMSGAYGATSDADGIDAIHAALDRGIQLIDTGDFYTNGHNELLVGRALKGRRDEAIISVKFGALRGPDGSWLGFDSRPAAVKNFLGYSLTRLGVDHIDIYRPSRLDPNVPIEETIGAIAEMVKAGWVKHIGLSEVGAETIRRANAVHPICDVQLEYSLVSRGLERSILPVVEQLGIAVTAYGILSRGLLSGSVPTLPGDSRVHFPRFRGENLAKNRPLVDALRDVATRKGCTPAQLATAWAMSKSEAIVPVLGVKRRAHVDDLIGAVNVELTPAEVAELESAVPAERVAGTRYAEPQLRALDSEK